MQGTYLWDFIYWCFRYVYIAVVDAFNYKMSYCDKEKIFNNRSIIH